ncbi:hypothetical protein MPLB_1670095 [Mesorhizobium sp. ORS 3324]|nr:hypothetical protein MPLB_1670095 [Mesorhizobium sp. ORS 3324]
MDPFSNINRSHVSDFARTDDAGSQQQQTDQARFQEHLNALQPGQHRPAVPNSRLARRTGSHADAVGPRMLQEEGAGEGDSHLPFAPPAHSPAQSFDQDELFAAADRAGPLPAASFASAQFWQDAERVAHSPAQSRDQPRSRAAIGDGYEALSSIPPPRVNLPATGFGSAPDGVSLPHVIADAYRPAANQQGDLTGARHTMPAAAPHQASVVQQTRSRKRGREHPDEALFAAYRAQAAKTAKVGESSIRGDITALRKFSIWLDENHQSQINGRIEDGQLVGLVKDFAGNDAVLLGDTKVALGRLRQHSAGQPVTAASAVRPGTKDDEELFAQYRAKAMVKGSAVRRDLAALRKFSKWLAENHRTQIAGRIEDPGLDALAKDFAERDDERINPALKRLRQASVRQPGTAASNVRPGTNDDEELFAQAAGLKERTLGGDLTGARQIMPAEAPHQPFVVQQTRSRKGGREHPDEALFAAYRAEAAKTAKVSESSIARDIVALRKFSKWLDENHQSQIDGRIDDEQLDGLANNFAGNDAILLRKLNVALERLRQHSAGQPVTIVSKIREFGTKDDEELLARYQTRAIAARLKEGTMSHDLAALRKFSKWLYENHRTQIAGRIEDPGLDSLAKDFAGNDAKLLSELNVALGRLRQADAGQTVTTARSRLISEENQVIEDACQAAASRYGQVTLAIYRSHLGRFNRWLSQNFGEGIARIEPAMLSRAVDEYKKNAAPVFSAAWGFLQKYRQMVAANNALGLAAHGQAAPREQPSGPPAGTVQSTSPVVLSPIPMSPGDPAWDVLRAFHEEEAAQRGAPIATNAAQFHQMTSLLPELAPVPAPSSSAQSAGSSSPFAGLAPLSPTPYRHPDFDLNALTPVQLAEEGSGSGHWTAVAGSAIAQPGSSRRSSQINAGLDDIVDLQDDAGSAPRSDAARSRSIAGPSPSSSVPGEGSAASSAAHGRLPDPGSQLGSREQADWGVRPAASPESYDQSQLWQDVDQAGRQRPAGWDRPWSAWSPQSDQDMGPARRSASARSSDIYRGLDPLVDLPSTPAELRDDAHYAPPPGTASDAQLKALNPRASSHDRSGLALAATQWLSDEHIQRDYELLAQELQRDNPNLAARTQLVDPLIAHYHLRLGSDNAALRAFQRIVYDRNGNDTADFLFLPVNDASATDPQRRGSHWSLLLVDRRERERPVAYHYDSAGRHNDQPAAQLAKRLGARLEPARITQQQNGYDCGVFVLDGTRALVGRLGQRWQPARLHLDNFVIDRQALQHRLRG